MHFQMKEDCDKEIPQVDAHLETRAKHAEWQDLPMWNSNLGRAAVQDARAA